MKSTHSFCTLAIATALALAIPAVYAADAPTLPTTKVSAITQTNQSYNRFIVTYRDGSSERSNRNAALQNVQSAVSRMGLDRATRSSTGAAIAPLTVSYQRKLAVGADLVRTSRKLSANEATTLMQQIATDPAVLHVEPDVMMRAVRDFRAPTTMKPSELISGAPNDPYYAQYQWDYNNPTGGANIEQAWSLADGTGITVAVLDTGITEHPDLDTSLADDGYDFISDSFVSGRDTDDRTPGGWDLGDWTTTEPWLSECTDAQNPPEDSSWHGTHVSGTVGEMTDNGVGMAGVAHNAKVLPIRVLGHCGGYNSDIADAIVWASGGHVDGVPDNQHPAQVINMSLGGGGVCLASDVTGTAIASALSRGTTVVVAAGNSGSDAGLFSPASCPGVIAVGSNGITGKRAFYSNYGATVSIAAPGGGIYPNDGSTGTPTNDGFIWSSLNDGETTPDNPVYGGMAGTSQATPHVAGAVALILSAQQQAGLPVSTPAKLRQLIMSTARPFPVPVDQPLGSGILDTYAAVQKALSPDDGGGEKAMPLGNGVVLSGQSGIAGDSMLYSFEVPAGASNLNLRSFGGTGDISLLVKAGSAPAENGSDADFTSARPGNTETVVIAKPQATTYYIRVVGVVDYNNLSILGIYVN